MLKISIPKPCYENWDEMTANNQGRHCNVCAKTVVDFTTMTDSEVQHFFLNRNQDQSTCGRFKAEQLGRITIELPPDIFIRRIAGWKKFLAACLLAFSSMLFSCDTSITRGEVEIAQPLTGDSAVAAKDSIPKWNGYVGGMVIHYDSTTVVKLECKTTTGITFSKNEDSLAAPLADTSSNNNEINASSVVTGMVFKQSDTLVTNDSVFIKLKTEVSVDCDDQPSINL